MLFHEVPTRNLFTLYEKIFLFWINQFWICSHHILPFLWNRKLELIRFCSILSQYFPYLRPWYQKSPIVQLFWDSLLKLRSIGFSLSKTKLCMGKSICLLMLAAGKWKLSMASCQLWIRHFQKDNSNFWSNKRKNLGLYENFPNCDLESYSKLSIIYLIFF